MSNPVKALIARHPVISFFVIACAWTWPAAALIHVSIAFPLLALFGPLVAGVAIIWARDGRRGLRALVDKFDPRRAGLAWYVVATLLPGVLLVAQWLLHNWWWEPMPFEMYPLSLLSVVIALLIVGEEVGWRGFLLPHLLERHGPIVASLIVGVLWGLWHLANFVIDSYPHYGVPFSAFMITTTAFSVLFTWLYRNTRGSLLIAVGFHAALNLFALKGVEPSRQYWVKAAIYTLVALPILITWIGKRQEPESIVGPSDEDNAARR